MPPKDEGAVAAQFPRNRPVIASALALLTLAAFAGVLRCGFVAFDDDFTVYANPHLRNGITAHGLRWALTADLLYDSAHAAYWMPLTTLTHMAAIEAFGMRPWAHHAINLLLHAANVASLFLVLRCATGAVWRSAVVAALFAVHPVQVESVAWVTSRKDLLSTFFALIALGAHVSWARQGGPGRRAAVVVASAMSMLAKPLLSLPLLLLLLDAWPLRRGAGQPAAKRWRGLIVEKAPVFALALASALTAYAAHARAGHLASLDVVPLPARVANAVQSLTLYVGQLAWPSGLSPLYPLQPVRLLALRPLLCAAACAVAVLAAWRWRHKHPHALFGLAWFVAVLLPMLGLVQAGRHSRADRFLYLALVGVAVAVVWTAVAALPRERSAQRWAGAGALVAIVALALATGRQVRYWRDTSTLFGRALQVVGGDPLIHVTLAWELASRRRFDEAVGHYEAALRLQPTNVQAHLNLAGLLELQGHAAAAAARLERAEQAAPTAAQVQVARAGMALRQGRPQEALERLRRAVALEPRSAAVRFTLANLLAQHGWPAEALVHYGEAVRLQPDHADSWNNYGLTLLLVGRAAEALGPLERALAIDPGHPQARMNHARARAALGL